MTTTDSSPEATQRDPRTVQFAAIAAVSTVAFALLTLAVKRRQTASFDEELLDTVAAQVEEADDQADGQVRRAAEAIHPAGKWWSYVPAAIVLAPVVVANGHGPLRRRIGGASSVVVATLISAAINPAFDRWLPQPPVPPGRRAKPKPSFPSGHTFGLGSLTITAACVLAREQIVPTAIVVPLAAAIPLLAGAARMAEAKHWPTDVAGGALVAITIATLSLALFETTAAIEDADD